MTQKNETKILVLSLLVTAVLLGTGFWLFNNHSGVKSVNSKNDNPAASESGKLEGRVSSGDKILIGAEINPSKQAGVAAFAKKDFPAAKTQFQESLKQNRNDPEALIYLNNASVANSNPLKIAVSVPIGSNLNIAKEILRGVAQAQDEINKSGGINGTPLVVAIANDDNDAEIAKQVADKFVKDPSFLAVVGHNASNASITAAPVYQQGKLVMISPTSFSNQLSGIGSYIFRSVTNVRFVADPLSKYAAKTGNINNIAVCFDASAPDNTSFKDEFILALLAEKGKVVNIKCDLSADNFDPKTAVSQAISNGADSLLLAPHVDKINRAIEVAQANNGRLKLLGSPTLYTIQTLQQGKSAVNGMVLAVTWHPKAIPGNSFAENAVKLWGGDVGWRSATAYDATEAIITGLKQNKTREGLQQALSNQVFSADGATGAVQFLPSGDRKGTAILVQVQPGQISKTGFDFTPLKP
jgi:branched-chain amino acid transport system substrate-binding protein